MCHISNGMGTEQGTGNINVNETRYRLCPQEVYHMEEEVDKIMAEAYYECKHKSSVHRIMGVGRKGIQLPE